MRAAPIGHVEDRVGDSFEFDERHRDAYGLISLVRHGTMWISFEPVTAERGVAKSAHSHDVNARWVHVIEQIFRLARVEPTLLRFRRSDLDEHPSRMSGAPVCLV